METLGLVAGFSVFEDFLHPGETALKSTRYGVLGVGSGYEKRGEFRFQ